MQTYMEIVDIRTGDARHTGIGFCAARESTEITRQQFEIAREFDTGKEDAEFLLDMYIAGDLSDTIGLDAGGVEIISGQRPESPEYYVDYDKKYCKKRRNITNHSSRIAISAVCIRGFVHNVVHNVVLNCVYRRQPAIG